MHPALKKNNKQTKKYLNFLTALWQKLQIQEKAVTEVKAAIKPYYQKKDITKEEYKEIVRKAVEKVSVHVFGGVYFIFIVENSFHKPYRLF